ncbi:MAG: nucleotidyltransferase domain-containing protein [Clostridiales bacterium]|nr:nucleotidyltransferase domain-containing protein [Clostridiales bacterium]
MEYIYSLEKISEIIVPIARRCNIKKVAIFGSYARGDAHEASDVDILYELKTKRDLDSLSDFIDNLDKSLYKNYDLVEYNNINKYMKNDILDEAIVLYE